jgi:hypothetical protein
MEGQVAPTIGYFIMSKLRTKWGFFCWIKQKLEAQRKSINLSRYAGVLVVLCFVGVYGALRVLSPQREAAQVKFIEAYGGEQSQAGIPSESQLKNPFSGPEYEKALRLKETSALGMAISLSVLVENTRTGRLPGNVTEICRSLNSTNLLPPGIQFNNGIISSDQSTFYIAYQREPFSFEVLSTPRSDHGTQLLFRFPLPQSEPNSVLYFEARRDQPLPEALLTTEQLSALGWKIRHWQGDALSLDTATLDSLKEQNALLNEH